MVTTGQPGDEQQQLQLMGGPCGSPQRLFGWNLHSHHMHLDYSGGAGSLRANSVRKRSEETGEPIPKQGDVPSSQDPQTMRSI